ncbi:MAG TPA: dethiobiotin synthase [Lacunisphaera sp.]|jgi:8-amino-7-oxononanoate synthase/dethiobiotin synthase
MRSVLVTGTDTGVGKTQVCGALARLLANSGARVQVVKLVECGHQSLEEGDAMRAQQLANCAGVEPMTVLSFPLALAPLAAAADAGVELSLSRLISLYDSLPPCDWRIIEGAGGIAVPLDRSGADWADFADQADIDEVVLVVPERLGAINQTRLAYAYACDRGLRPKIWFNATIPVEPAVASSHRTGLQQLGLGVFASQSFTATLPDHPEQVLATLLAAEPPLPNFPASGDFVTRRSTIVLAERDRQGLRRQLRVLTERSDRLLNLADNDYLDLSHDPAVRAAVQSAALKYGTSASASPLITGWLETHARLVQELCTWHGFEHGLLWSSGYAANSAILGTLPQKGDVVLADRLIHHSMIAGLRRSGARLKRYPHLDLQRLEAELALVEPHPAFVVTETVFSMDGDYPDLRRMAALKEKYRFFWVVDEAHALGWYGPGGSGMARAAGVHGQVDILVGTLGKTLASGGAYALFSSAAVRDYLINHAGEFIYSTSLPPTAVAAASAALSRVQELSVNQASWQGLARNFRQRLRSTGWKVPDGDSPVVPVHVGPATETVALAAALRADGIIAGAVRPPTVPEGTSRLRFSLKRTLTEADVIRVLEIMTKWRHRV